jgi:hypothetical protein
MLYMLKHGSSYVIYAPYIQKIINSKTGMEFQYDGGNGAYMPQLVQTPHTSPPAVATSRAGAHVPPARGHATSSTSESSRAIAHRGMKQNILVKGLKTIIPPPQQCPYPRVSLIDES